MPVTPRHGKTTRVLYGAYDLSTSLKEASVQRSMDTAETSAFLTSAKTYVVGMETAQLSLGGMFAGDAGATDVLWGSTYMAQDTPVPISIGFDSGLALGKRVFTCQAFQTQYAISGSISDMVAANLDAQCTDVGASGLVLHSPDASQSITTSGQDVGQDMGAAGTARIGAALHILTTNVAVGTVTFKIATATTQGGSYTDLLTLVTGFTGSTPASYFVVSPGSVAFNQWFRFAWVSSGSPTGSVTALATVARLAA